MSVAFIWEILAQALILTLATIPFFTEKEMTKKRYLFCTIYYFIFSDIVVMAFAVFYRWIILTEPVTIIAMEITFITVFIVVYFIMYLSEKKSVTKMNEQLKKLKQS